MSFPVLAKSIQIDSALITAIVVGLVMALFKVIDWVVSRYRSPSIPTPPESPAHWTDITGEIRPVLNQECASRHSRLTEELKNGSAKMGKLEDSIQEVKAVLVEVRQEIGAGVELRIRDQASTAAASEVQRHEAVHHKLNVR